MKDITRVLGVMSHIIGSLSATGLLIFLVALGWSVWQEVHKN